MNGNRFAVVKRKCKQEKTRHFKTSQAQERKKEKPRWDRSHWMQNELLMMQWWLWWSTFTVTLFENVFVISSVRATFLCIDSLTSSHQQCMANMRCYYHYLRLSRSIVQWKCLFVHRFDLKEKTNVFFRSKKTVFLFKNRFIWSNNLFSWYWRYLNKTRSNIWLQTKHFPICNCNLNEKLVYFRKKEV